MNAYSELYLADAMQNMAEMTEYASIACKLDLNDFFKRWFSMIPERNIGAAGSWHIFNGDLICRFGQF